MRPTQVIIASFLLTFLFSCASQNNELRPVDLRVEYLTNPIGIDRTEPMLSWQLRSDRNGSYQSAYQIRVAHDSAGLESEIEGWDSGKIPSSQQLNIRYTGPELESFSNYYWKVRVWDEHEVVSDWSSINTWKMGPLAEEDWLASWVSHKYADVVSTREPFSRYDDSRTFDAHDSMAVYLRKEIELDKKIEKATVFISGLGYYELYINSNQIGDRVMDPVFTDYQKQVKYTAYDVTSSLQEGGNALGVILGNGFYNLVERDLFQMEKANWKTPKKMKMLLLVEYTDGSQQKIGSDTTWTWSYGPILYNSIRGGETIDSRVDLGKWASSNYNYDTWKQVTEVPAPIGRLTYQYMPPMREVRSVEPVASWSPKENVYVFDFGENLTGYADLSLHGEAGQKVFIDFNEGLNEDSTLNVKHSSGHTWGRFQHNQFILSGQENDEFQPQFTYHGFRYVQISGIDYQPEMSDIMGKPVHTDLKTIGSFECSNERLNQLHSAVRKTLRNSVHSMPGEEPTREKMGWTFDAGMATMQSYLYNFDVINTYKKYLQDLIDAQEPNGHVPPIVPTNGWGFLEKKADGSDPTILYDDPWWGGTIAFVADQLFRFTSDTSILREAYNPVKQYADFVASTAQEHLVYWSLGDWLDLKQWANGWGPGLTPIVQTSTAANYYLHDKVAFFADILDKSNDGIVYRKKADVIKNKFNETFLQADGWYNLNSQTAQALPLYLGLVPKERQQQVLSRLVAAVEHNNFHTSVGFVGVTPLLTYLSRNGYLNQVYQMVIQEESPGWLHFVKNEKSTLGENLNAEGYGTGHHPFASVIGYWFYEHLGGIQVSLSQKYDVILSPGINTPLEWVQCSYETLKGKIVSNWRKDGSTVVYDVELPPGSRAKLLLPEQIKQIAINNKPQEINQGEMIISSGSHQIQLQF